MPSTVLEMQAISKSFGGVQALDGLHFELEEREIHALLGENGAGKSTLIKVLGGIHKPDGGKILIDGQEVSIEKVQDAQALGIGIIHQEIVLVPHLSVAENIFLGREPVKKSGFKNMALMNQQAQEMVAQLGLNIDVRKNVSELSIAQQQLVEITKAVSFDIKILVMDEPTSSLTGEDVQNLFHTMERLRDKGISIIYISHRFEELFSMTDRITVIRDGTYVGTKRTRETNTNELVKMMVGRNIENLYTRTKAEVEKREILRVEGLSKENFFRDIDFTVHAGEIVGFSGLVGAGRSEVMLSIFGAHKYETGKVYLYDQEIHIKSCIDAINHGIAMVPEDRKDQGLVLKNSVGFNLTLANLRNLMKNPLIISEAKRKESIQKYVNDLRVKTASADISVSSLSGGNQQKVVLAKWLSINPSLLILDEPTRGVDVGAKSEIYSIMNQLANQGLGIILISSDLPEILNMSDRVCVMREGELVKTLEEKEDITQETIMNYATGGDNIKL
ncbi:sugar ABC transporter ATP-binding protein [Gracilibacillus alcaliphilus]|uniref:sugar ABC transporter ATP-binding protein n=1 Tax=Gracilibacillus alcaliphilus TaxID=1401441 RepID=UPI00195D56B2|nr:sugar ABC transporter ATP-binding protein [Gracilibacillus alcaliphilus]MBM7679621.1 ribose transport system ATP-binding protein [Gracilibacillus alcaliphilus]